jgi:hypothetical protein
MHVFGARKEVDSKSRLDDEDNEIGVKESLQKLAALLE